MTATMPASARGRVRSNDGTAISYETVGVGEGLLVLGGAWRTSRDYLPFARALSDSLTVHVIDRRGRGRSGPQGAQYSIAREIEDLPRRPGADRCDDRVWPLLWWSDRA